MSHTGKFATSAECIGKAGANYNTTDIDEARINEFCLQAESYINSATRYNWTDAWDAASLNVDVKYLLTEAESDLVAIYMIQYDMSGYTTRMEAETMLDVLWSRFNKCITLLAEVRDYVEGA